MRDDDVRDALQRHWAASDANDFDAEHAIYREDAVLEYPQSGERIRGNFEISTLPEDAMQEIRDGITTNIRFNSVVTTGVPGFIPRVR